ncbi:MAG: hypothetical protein ACFCUU_03245 [Cyclobacteriaceae bacterium]
MIKKFTFLFILSTFLLVFSAYAQVDKTQSDTLMSDYDKEMLEALYEFENDSLGFLSLIDSLLKMEDQKYSVISIRTGYVSNIVNAGRSFGVNQFGLNTGTSYYHHSGFFVDLAAFWNSQFEPAFGPVITTAGYMGEIKPWWTIVASYDHFFQRDVKSFEESDEWVEQYLSTLYPTLNNALNLSQMLNHKKFFANLDYTFLFGQQTAHRIMGNFSGNLILRDKWIFDRIRFMPGVNILLGNATVTNFRIDSVRIGRSRRFRDVLVMEQNNAFGLMNYGFTTPLSLSIGKYSMMLSYQYNKPVSLPGERLDTQSNSYVSLALIYNLMIKH